MSKLYKRGKVWWARFQGKRRSTGCTDRRAAELTLAEWQRIAASPTYATAAATRLDEAAERMIRRVRSLGRSEKTIAYYEGKVGHLLRVFGDAMPLSRIDSRAIDDYVDQREKEGATSPTIAKEVGALRRILRIAARRGEYPHSVTTIMPDDLADVYEPRRSFLPEDKALALLKALPPHRAAWVAFAIGTGARLSEIARARREDIDLEHGRVRIRGKKTKKAKRVVPITSLSRPLLELALRDGDGSGGLLFSEWTNVRRSLATACKKIGIDRLTPNDLRRTHATWLRARGIDSATIAELLGHVDARMVERVYGKLTTDMIAASIEQHLSVAPVSILYETRSDSVDTGDAKDSKLSELLRARHDSNVRPADSKSEIRAHENAEKNAESASGKRGTVSNLYGAPSSMHGFAGTVLSQRVQDYVVPLLLDAKKAAMQGDKEATLRPLASAARAIASGRVGIGGTY